IRTPMNGVIGMLELLAETPLNPEQRKMLFTVRDSAFSLLNILNDILDFSKIEAGRMELEQAPFSVLEVVEGVTEMLVPLAQKKQLRLNCLVDPAVPGWLLGDAVRVRQILFNLCSNAVKFTETSPRHKGQVTLLAECTARSPTHATLVFRVQDNGIGISEAALRRLFNPFSQGESSTTRHFGGTGLGLSICKRLIDMMGGSIQVESHPGHETRFEVCLSLPLATSPTTSEPPHMDNLEVRFLMSNDPMIAGVRRYLAHFGARVSLARTLTDAQQHLIECLQKGNPLPVLLCALDDPQTQIPELQVLRALPELAPLRILPLISRELALPESLRDLAPVWMHPMRRDDLIYALAATRDGVAPAPSSGADTLATIKTLSLLNGRRPRILVAEDNATNQEVVAMQLARLGADCVVVGQGKDALARLH
ncbi:MAG: histidine kinase, partial [Gammaproteobacteria bacterium]|nr:histidine kinase [Gammaproteobacteria bacterium]